MDFLRAIIVAFIVAGVLDLITKRTSKKTDSLDKFVVRAPIDFAALFCGIGSDWNGTRYWCINIW